MKPVKPSDSIEPPKDVPVRIDTYFIRHTGLITNQTILKLGEYNLIVVPAGLSLTTGSVLVVLTAAEVSLFSKYNSQLNSLTLSFQELNDKDVTRLHIKTHLESITPIPDRKDVCIIKLKFKTCPGNYESIITTYRYEQRIRKEYYESTPGDPIPISPLTKSLLEYNGFCEIQAAEIQRVTLRTLSIKKAELASSQGWGSIIKGSNFSLKLYFKKFQFLLEATMEDLPENPRGLAKVSLGFSNELLDIMEDYHFKLSLLKKKTLGAVGS